jgi:hypothetical protein
MFTVSASAGPQWTKENTGGSSASLSLYANIAAAYSGHFSHMSLSYTSGANAGYGVAGGAHSNSVSFAAGRTFAQVWNGGATSSFTQSSGLPGLGSASYSLHTYVEAGQISRAIVRSISVYASYTFEDQSNPGSAQTVDLFSGISQVVGFGFTYSPSAIHFGRQ